MPNFPTVPELPGETRSTPTASGTTAEACALEGATAYGLFWLDLSGCVSRWCDECRDLFGLTRAQALGMRLDDFLLPEERDRGRAAAILSTVEREGSWEGSGWRLRGDGSAFWAASSVTRVRTPNGVDIGFTVVTHDLSGLVAGPAEPLVTEDAARLVSVGRMATDVSHDMRNIFSAIRGFAGLLERHLPPDGRCHRAWHELLKACDRGTSLTARLVDVGRREESEEGSCDIGSVLEEAEPLLRQLLPGRISLEVAVDERLPAVPVSATDAELTILNLVVNARDAIAGRGTITIHASAEEGRDGARGEIALVVSDDGSGMEDEVARRAFERRFTTKDTGLGTGLGLAIVRETVTRAGGSIALDSTPGRGTVVRALLPAVPETDTPRGTASDRPAARARRRLRALVCCDSSLLAGCVTELLRREGVRVTRKSGDEIPSGVEMQEADILLLESAACGAQGWTSVEEGPRPVAVWLVGAGDRSAPPLRPGDVVVEWPFSPDELLLEVRALVRQREDRAAVH